MTNKIPAVSSTIGYCMDIDFLQCRHFPLSKIKLNTGRLSYQAICVLHLGQQERFHLFAPFPPEADPPLAETGMRGIFSCRRQIKQFKNEPMIKPKTKIN